jgi:hypothetical protein
MNHEIIKGWIPIQVFSPSILYRYTLLVKATLYTRLAMLLNLFVVKLFMRQSNLECFGRSATKLDVLSSTVFVQEKLIALQTIVFIMSSLNEKLAVIEENSAL